jgi:predicted aspartyl protease
MIAAMALGASFALPAAAQDCGPLKQAASLDLTPFAGGRFLAPVTINGTVQPMLVNTAAGITSLTSAAVETMGLHRLSATGFKALDSTGNASQSYVHADVTMGAIRIPGVELLVTPNPGAGAEGAFAGFLAGDLLSRYDAEFDFSARKLNVFLQDHCPGHVLYWNPTVAAVVPIDLHRNIPSNLRAGYARDALRDIHLWVPVLLDGKPFKAAINTGAPNSTLSATTARTVFGITADSPDSKPLGMVDGNPDHKVFGRVFSTLTFEGVTVGNPHVVVMPDLVGSKDPNNSRVTGSNIAKIDDNIGAEMTIGMDVLRKLHLYVAFGERKLYITPASPPAGPNPPAPEKTRAAAPRT